MKNKPHIEWKRRVVGGWITADGKWAIRGPIWGKPMFWVYTGNQRFTPTGRYDDCVSFKSVAAAKNFVREQYAKLGMRFVNAGRPGYCPHQKERQELCGSVQF